jgi:hypothetical protein
MRLNLLNRKNNQLYADLKPGERIEKLLVEYLEPILETKGFNYLKSQKEFKKKNDFFDFHVSWCGSRLNTGNEIVKFNIFINVFSPKYRKLEFKFYELTNRSVNAIDGSSVYYIKGWDKKYYDSWYDLTNYDNHKLMDHIRTNIKNIAFTFFDNYTSFETAIKKLNEDPITNFEKIIDFYIIQNKWEEAKKFFDQNKQWFEESQYSRNKKLSFELRKEKIISCYNNG